MQFYNTDPAVVTTAVVSIFVVVVVAPTVVSYSSVVVLYVGILCGHIGARAVDFITV